MLIASIVFLILILYLGISSVGHKFFIHQFYVSKLLQLFEYGNRRVEKVNQRLQQNRERKRKLSLIQEGADANKISETESETDSAYDEDMDFDRSNCKYNGGLSLFISNCQFDHPLVQAAIGRHRSASLRLGDEKHVLDLFAVSDFARLGIQAIVDDEVTKRFAAKELQTWNLLTRTDKFYHYKSLRLAMIWWSGMIFRYFIMFPIRFVITLMGVTWLIVSTALIGLIPEGECT